MGNCCSGELRSGVAAKVILHDGTLKEFLRPVKASRVLEEIPGCFVCDSDEMEFGGVFSEVDDEEELRPGQLYFALPKDLMNSLIQLAEMASLAAKASLALDMGGGVGCGCIRRSKIDPLMALDPYDRGIGNDGISVECVGLGSKDGCIERMSGCNSNCSGRRRSVATGRDSFSSNLSIILEEFD